VRSITTALLLLLLPGFAHAIPAFARKYKTSCLTCHEGFPRLNPTGRVFRNNGYRFPAGMEKTLRKEKPVSLGSEHFERVWPQGVWPSDIAATAPIAFHAVGRLWYFDESELTSFEIPHELELLFGGTIGKTLSYFGMIEYEPDEPVGFGFKLQYDPRTFMHVNAGNVGLEDGPAPPTQDARRWTRTHYNVSVLRNASGTWKLNDGAGGGLAVWGASDGPRTQGGLTYVAGVGNGQSGSDNLDVDRSKDVFARVTYKIAGRPVAGAQRDDDTSVDEKALRVGVFLHRGTAVDDSTGQDRFHLAGADVSLWFDSIHLAAAAARMESEYLGATFRSRAAFVEGSYAVYPWLFGYARFEYTDVSVDDATRAEQTLIPAVLALIRANVKLVAEYRGPLESNDRHGDATIQLDFAF